MKVLLAQNTLYIPTFAGENRGNRLLVEGLAARGHVCRAIAPACGKQGPQTTEQFLQELQIRGLGAEPSRDGDAYVFRQRGVEVHAVSDPARPSASTAWQRTIGACS